MPGRTSKILFEPPYDQLLKDTLRFGDLRAAEETLARLEKFRQRFLAASDKKGVQFCRRLALLGRRRAELIGRNPRVGAAKRLEKQEIALWFRIWLETPEFFCDWLELRKKSADYRMITKSAPPAADGDQ